ncbi:MAG: AAA family ATPase, partial [Gammaproteobacteria bacterium]|nr:AAA family ATPase [Gammaproteobacteria bacterium]
MKRDIFQKLMSWKQAAMRKPLILDGARQVGKTYALQHFGKTAYQSVAYINFERDERVHDYFTGALDP